MSDIVIVTLRAPEALTIRGQASLEQAERLFVQTSRHPSASVAETLHQPFETMDEMYDACESFDSLNEAIAERLVSHAPCVYLATGNITDSQLPAIRRAAEQKGLSLTVLPALSAAEIAFPELPSCAAISCAALPNELDPSLCYAIDEVDSRMRAGEAKLLLGEYFPDDWTIRFANRTTNDGYTSVSIPLYELDRQECYDATSVLYVPAVPFEQRTRYGFADVMHVVRRLRAPNGCPWDREQTHASLKNALLEECYELLDAIDANDDAHICEEMGDVLLQYALHAAIAEEQAAFTERDAATELVEKLIYRHPHVFGNVAVSGSLEVLKNWDALKMAQRKQQTQSEVLKSVPRNFPALIRSRKVQKKAADVGFDWPSAEKAFPKIDEEARELLDAMHGQGDLSEEAGDLLFAVVNVLRLLHLEPESLLAKATDKFIDRFERMEALAHKEGTKLETLSFAEQDALWNRVKKCPKRL